VAGFESCGCFGPLKVSPWLTLALDLNVSVIASWASQSIDTSSSALWRSPSVSVFGSVFLLLSLLSSALMVQGRPMEVQSESELIDTNGEFVLLKPESWIERPFPLSAFIDPPINVNDGCWTIVLVHHDCPDCQALVAGYAMRESKHVADAGRTVVVEIPPYAASPMITGDVMRAQLSQKHNWFAQTPTQIRIQDGKVVSVSRVGHGGSNLALDDLL
jgi:hypothetical protein